MKKLFSVFILTILLASGSTSAQWKIIAPNLFTPSGGVGAHSGLSFRDGLLWLVNSDVYMSTDSGMSWTKPCPKVPWSGTPYDIQFFDRQVGIVTSYLGAWITRDQGATWKNITSNPIYSATFGNSSQVFALGAEGGSTQVTTNGGTTWNLSQRTGFWTSIVYLKNGNFLSLFGSGNGPGSTCVSTDLGIGWTPGTNGIHSDSWGIAVDSCDQNLVYVVSENWVFQTDNTSQIYRSTDQGNSWTVPISRSIPFLCGSLSLSPGAAYCQTLNDGVYRSTDHGLNWKTIGGPTNDWDTRLIVAINDNIILAADQNGNIWRTTNSGGNAVSGSVELSSITVQNDTLGATVYVPIKLTGATVKGTLDLSLHFDTAMLVYRGTYLSNTANDITTSANVGVAHIHFDTPLQPAQDSTIGFAAFQVFPTNTPCTKIVFDSISIASAAIACAFVNPSFSATICSSLGCGTTSLSNFLRYKKLPTLSVIPNPASGLATLHSDSDLGEVSISIYDAMGELRSRIEGTLSATHSASINTSSLPSGLYSVRIESAGYAGSIRLMHVK
jgi:photosystem II stability/assembly factor-like uncharacterized protein